MKLDKQDLRALMAAIICSGPDVNPFAHKSIVKQVDELLAEVERTSEPLP